MKRIYHSVNVYEILDVVESFYNYFLRRVNIRSNNQQQQ